MHNRIKLIFTAMITMLVTNSYAANPGFYIGLMTGPGTNGAKQENGRTETPPPLFTPMKPRSNIWNTRLYAGYKIFTYGGVEGGVSYFSNVHFDSGKVQTCGGSPMAKVRAFDLVGKGELPFHGFTAFVKAGVGIVYVKTSAALNPPENVQNTSDNCGKSVNKTKFNPTYSIGGSYDINQNWVVEVDATHLATGGIVNYVNYIGVGFSFHLVDTYCGQFLCD